MVVRIVIACAALGLALSGCSGDKKPEVMPDVQSKRLDMALSDLDRAGIENEAEILGGGTFGIIDESNWLVCDQEPAPGGAVDGAPRLTVDRSCEAEDDLAGEQPEAEAESPAPTKTGSQREQGEAETFAMPGLIGLNLQDAQDQLQSLGSYILTQTDGTGMERFQMLDSDWKVCGQVPAVGRITPLSRMVEVIAVKLDEMCP